MVITKLRSELFTRVIQYCCGTEIQYSVVEWTCNLDEEKEWIYNFSGKTY